MSPRSTLIPAALLVAGIAGIALIAFALISPQPTSPTSPPNATVTSAFTPTLTGTSTTTPPPTPTSTPVPISLPFVSPAGRLAYVEGGRLSVAETDGSGATVAEKGVAQGPQAVAWSPDGRRLLYETAVDESSYHVWDSETEETLDLDRDVPDFPPEEGPLREPIWSPGGTRLLFLASPDGSSGGAWVLDVEAARAWAVSRQAVSDIVWVEEDEVLYDTHGEGVPEHAHMVNIGPPVRPLTGTLCNRRTDTDVSLPPLHALSPGRRYLAVLEAHSTLSSQLQVLPLFDAPPLTLTVRLSVTAAEDALLWSPDGRWIAYGARATSPPGEEGLYTVLVDTVELSRTRVITGLLPWTWSPDGRMLAGPICAGAGCGLVVTDVLSDHVTRIVSGEGLRIWDLAWSPGGVYLAYSLTGLDAHPASLALWNRVTGERRLLMSEEEMHPFTDLQWTPDGCRLYLAQRETRAEGALPVKAIWGLGPALEDHWRIAPAPTEPPSATAKLEEGRDDGPQPCPAPLLSGRRLVAYYGTPLGTGLGILGPHDITTTLTLLDEQAQAYRDLDPKVETVPMFHMVTTIADDHAGDDEDYNHRVPHETIRQWINGIEGGGGWAVLDVQPGRADLDAELDLIEPLLLEPTVHLAVDPEFMVGDEEVPGEDMGRITGPRINRVQARVERIGRAIGQRKMLIVHQFDDRIVERKEAILNYPFVELVWDADGFGGSWSKIADYDQYREEAGFEHGGFKLFYERDDPLMTPAQVLALEPPPTVVIYQ